MDPKNRLSRGLDSPNLVRQTKAKRPPLQNPIPTVLFLSRMLYYINMRNTKSFKRLEAEKGTGRNKIESEREEKIFSRKPRKINKVELHRK